MLLLRIKRSNSQLKDRIMIFSDYDINDTSKKIYKFLLKHITLKWNVMLLICSVIFALMLVI